MFLRFFSANNYNFVDLATGCTIPVLLNEGFLWDAAIVAVVGVIVSIALRQRVDTEEDMK